MKLMVKEGIQARGEWGYAGREGGPAAVGCWAVGLTLNFQANWCTVELEEGKVLCGRLWHCGDQCCSLRLRQTTTPGAKKGKDVQKKLVPCVQMREQTSKGICGAEKT
jgi:hypothetical protein